MRAWQSQGGQELGGGWLTPDRKAAFSSGFQGKETQLPKTEFLQFLLVSGIKQFGLFKKKITESTLLFANDTALLKRKAQPAGVVNLL